jgi:hypothetical protein
MKKFNVLYKGRKIHQDLSHEQCAEVLMDLSETYYDDENFDINEIELEEI